MSQNGMLIALTEAKFQVRAADSLEDRLRATMKATYDHWATSDEDEQFRAAVGAVLLLATDEEKERITVELEGLRAVAAMLEGVPVDIARIPVPERPVRLRQLWDETVEEYAR